MVIAPQPEELFGLAPSPDGGALELLLPCPATPDGRGKKHPVVIRADWSVDVPHDLDAERVAVAFGAYSSCLHLVERAIPSVRAALPVLTRHARPPILRLGTGAWAVHATEALPHCCRQEFRRIEYATTHLRSAAHVAGVRQASVRQVNQLLRGFAAHWFPWEGAAPSWSGVDRLVRDADGVDELWRAGIHPRELERLAGYAEAVTEPLPVGYYLGVAYGDVDPAWLRTIVARRPDADTATWLATMPVKETVGAAEEWAAWLGHGMPRPEVRHAVASGMPASDVATAVSATGWSGPVAARNVFAWALTGCRPTAEHYRLLASRGVDHPRPSRGTVDAAVLDVADALGVDAVDLPDRTELAVMLELLGSRPALLAAVRRGLLSAAALDDAPDLLPYARRTAERTA